MGDETPGSGISSKLAEQSMKGSHMMQGMRIAHGTEVEDSGIAVSAFDALHFSGNSFQGLVPGNAGKLAGPSGPGPFERVKKPVRGIDPLSVGVPPGT
jgi:hypothetical protein